MSKRTVKLGLVTAVALWAGPAMAQTTGGSLAPPPPWYLGASGGTGVVEKFGGAAGAEGGLRIAPNLDAIGELAWGSNTATARQLGKVDTLAAELGRLPGATAEGTMKVPVFYGGLGLRYVIDRGWRIRPYVMGSVGAARITLEPTITLAGADVSNSLAQYGVTLGQDVIGKYNRAAGTGGVGILLDIGAWYVDTGVRLTSISGEEQRSNWSRLVLGGGRRF
jgi:hypothetical protein